MQKVAVKELIEFKRRTSEQAKRRFVQKLVTRMPKEKKMDDDGNSGDYWITSTSCINKVFKTDNVDFYDEKIDELTVKLAAATDLRIKSMHQRNIDILSAFKEFVFDDIKPARVLKFETVHAAQKIIDLEGLPLYLNPKIVYSFEESGKKHVGAMWLITQMDGFKKAELGVFCETLYRFLYKHYAETHQISENFCVAIDTFKAQKLNYRQLLDGKVSLLLDKTLAEIKALSNN